MAEMAISSPAFGQNQMIPRKYTCEGADISPPLEIKHIPAGTVTLALIMDDPDAPNGTWDHWIVWNISPAAEIVENSVPVGAVEGRNSWGKNRYGGPCPPSGTHRYFFKLYALDTKLGLKPQADKCDVEQAIDGHVLSETSLVGLYKKGSKEG